jgi:hypothetical protein
MPTSRPAGGVAGCRHQLLRYRTAEPILLGAAPLNSRRSRIALPRVIKAFRVEHLQTTGLEQVPNESPYSRLAAAEKIGQLLEGQRLNRTHPYDEHAHNLRG